MSELFQSPHHLPRRRQPLSSLHYSKGAVAQLLEQRQILLRDEAGQSLLLPVHRSTTTRLCGQDSLPQAQWGGGRQLTEGGGRLALLGEVSSVWTLPAEHLGGGRERPHEAGSAMKDAK